LRIRARLHYLAPQLTASNLAAVQEILDKEH
jgi:hypothetical protein